MNTAHRVALTSLAVVVAAAIQLWRPAAAHAISYPSNEIWVDASDGNDATGTGTPASPFRTIGKGLAVARSGYTVFVRAGLYNSERFPIRMKEKVKLLGTRKYGAAGVKIRVPGPDGVLYDFPIIHGGAVMEIPWGDDPTGTARFVSVLGADYGYIEHFVIYVLDQVTSDAEEGVVYATGIHCNSTHPFIRYNTFKAISGWRPAYGHEGIQLVGSSEPIVSFNTFTSATLHWGVTVHGTSRPDISNNTFTSGNGIDMTAQAGATVFSNDIACPNGTGIEVQGQAAPRIYGNSIHGNGRYGIFVSHEATPDIYENVIESNGSYAGRFATESQGGVVVLMDAQPDLVGDNQFRNNTPWDLYNASTNPLRARGNTWTNSGPVVDGELPPPIAIDRYDIYDDDECGGCGAVSF